ncbi:MAG: hypothetical protein HZA58_08900 [Acidimicrobiia bacterium]|nr:hypothetical protein [Acidimicrobiia bacterium]
MKQHPGTFTAGLIFVVIGVAYLLEALEVWQVNVARTWPLVLIAAGIVVILNSRRGHGADAVVPPVEPPGEGQPPPA